MAFSAEIGGAANSFVSVETADAYQADFGRSYWAALSVEERQAALIVGTLFVESVGKGRWPGVKTYGRAQARDWPRSGAEDIDGYAIDSASIPSEIVTATIEAADYEAQNVGSLLPTITKTAITTQERVEGAVSVSYADVSKMSAEEIRPLVLSVESALGGIIDPTMSPAVLVL